MLKFLLKNKGKYCLFAIFLMNFMQPHFPRFSRIIPDNQHCKNICQQQVSFLQTSAGLSKKWRDFVTNNSFWKLAKFFISDSSNSSTSYTLTAMPYARKRFRVFKVMAGFVGCPAEEQTSGRMRIFQSFQVMFSCWYFHCLIHRLQMSWKNEFHRN